MSPRTKYTYKEAKFQCAKSGGKLAEPDETDNEELKSFQVFTSMFLSDVIIASLFITPLYRTCIIANAKIIFHPAKFDNFKDEKMLTIKLTRWRKQKFSGLKTA